jgi:hypothetical protein
MRDKILAELAALDKRKAKLFTALKVIDEFAGQPVTPAPQPRKAAPAPEPTETHAPPRRSSLRTAQARLRNPCPHRPPRFHPAPPPRNAKPNLTPAGILTLHAASISRRRRRTAAALYRKAERHQPSYNHRPHRPARQKWLFNAGKV